MFPDVDNPKRPKNMEDVKVIPRNQWGAADPESVEALTDKTAYIVVTWTNTDRCHTQEECSARIREIQKADLNEEGLPDIKYNFLIGHDRNLYEGRGWNIRSNVSDGEEGKLKEFDGKCIYVAFIGAKDDLPYPHMLQTLAGLCNIGVNEGYMTRQIKYIRVYKGEAEVHENVFEQNPMWLGSEKENDEVVLEEEEEED